MEDESFFKFNRIEGGHEIVINHNGYGCLFLVFLVFFSMGWLANELLDWWTKG